LEEIIIKGRIVTDFSGHCELLRIYNELGKYRNTNISLSFNNLRFIDANLTALLTAIINYINKKNNIVFFTDLNFLEDKFPILFQNGFIKDTKPNINSTGTDVRLTPFKPKDKYRFLNYIDNDLFNHSGMPNKDVKKLSKIKESLLEVFVNIDEHANTDDSIYACGQYFPKPQLLKFTLVDTGDGYLPKINKFTGGAISTSIEAIQWAISGNTTKNIDTPGGLGLSMINKYASEKFIDFHIATGNSYWVHTTGRQYNWEIQNYFPGTTINLVFKCF
jgi:hypothetical protein